jgi:hypothetical protein
LPQDEEELVGIYRKLTPPNQIVTVRMIDVLLDGQKEKGEKVHRADTSKESG